MLMSRREMREQIFKLLFRVEFNQREEMPEQEQFFFEDEENTAALKDCDQIRDKVNRIVEKLDEIDEKLNMTAEGWQTKRMGKVDLTILRLAVYEIKYDEDIPTGVAINEAVELCKKYATTDDASFVNGILATVSKTL